MPTQGVQRGRNRNACFLVADDDCLVYLECLAQG